MPQATVPPRALILLAVLTLVWGTNWPLFAFAVREVSVWSFRAVAVSVAGVVLLAIARLRGQSLLIPRQHRVRICVATFFYLVLWNIASTYSAILIPSGQSAVLGFTMPLWSALISWAVLGERLGKRLVLAVALGAWVHGEPLGPSQWLAMACCVGALWLALVRPAVAAPARA